ncbi:MAG: hypothetical protein EPO65_01305 [Dehalococcoidia bacterium]|nr:MAG: hypothetical protein EPO65_01305 [Dehalococcoidia bacterium]
MPLCGSRSVPSRSRLAQADGRRVEGARVPLAVDVSNYTGAISGAKAAALRTAGVGRAIVQIVDPPPGYPPSVFRQQIPVLLDAGFEVEAYVYLWLGGNTAHQVLDAIARVAPWRARLRRMWLDAEDVSVPEHQQANRAAIDAAVGACSMPAGVYTAGWWWRPYMGDSSAFAQLPLWAAEYDGDASTRFTPFGGWNACAMKQHIGDTSLAGIGGIDLNWYENAPTVQGIQQPLTGSDVLQWYRAVTFGAGTERVEVVEAVASTRRDGWRRAVVEWLP